MNYLETISALRALGHKYIRSCTCNFKGKNFMTPNIVNTGKINGLLIELSYGTGMSHNLIFGVSVLDRSGERHKESQCCHSLTEVEEVLVRLREEYK